MNKYFLITILLPISVFSQDASVVTPSAYGTSSNNYIRSWDAVKPDGTEANFTTSSPLAHSRITSQYLDGLGRPVQSVVKQGSYPTGGTAVDMVSSTVYDELGRIQRQYLPFAANNTGGNSSISDGLFKLNPFAQQQWFYSDNNSGSPIKGQGETYYYSKIEFEASPLNRTDRMYAAGNNWVNAGNGIKNKYLVNTITDSVRIWKVTNGGANPGVFGGYTCDSLYKAGELLKYITTDENNKQSIIFQDKEGKIILKKVQFSSSDDNGTGKGYSGWYCTYYIYDDLGLLRCIVQPKGVELLQANSWNITWNSNVILNEQCFRYEYDLKNRLIMKKMPGANAIEMVYDLRDRIAMIRDGNMTAANQWMVTRYDSLNRPWQTWLYSSSSSRATHQSSANWYIDYPTNAALSGADLLTETYYDNYDLVYAPGYYPPMYSSHDTHLATPSNTTYPYPQAVTACPMSKLKGKVTGTKVRLLGTPNFYVFLNFYDDYGRLIQAQKVITDFYEVRTIQYTWTNLPYITVHEYNKGAKTAVVVSKNTYDSLLRITKVEKKVSYSGVNAGAMSNYVTVAENEYDPLGKIKKKKLGAAPVETLDYDYNIRGWLLGANRDYAKSASSTNNYFGFDLGYDKNGITPTGGSSLGAYAATQFNGNITGMVWKSTGDDEIRKYDYTYDVVNRLTGADFNQYTGGFNKNAGLDFSVSGLSYDANGNIQSMKRRGFKATSSITIDTLLYTYISNSNRLLKVVDGITADNKLGDFNDGANGSNDDYSYDPNGNMVKDKNKDLQTYAGGNGIEYNYLNLVSKVTFKQDAGNNKGTIEYIYDALGNKVKKIITEGTRIVTYLYNGTSVFRKDTLESIMMEDGMIRYNVANNTLQYDYFMKDHLGNVRMVLTTQ
ncbi:MAG: hypothetical protein J7497_10745, partial [Chitinophagaceae bacterium]|nr:hypothetical protein [Chitinophagaceae bacterium]